MTKLRSPEDDPWSHIMMSLQKEKKHRHRQCYLMTEAEGCLPDTEGCLQTDTEGRMPLDRPEGCPHTWKDASKHGRMFKIVGNTRRKRHRRASPPLPEEKSFAFKTPHNCSPGSLIHAPALPQHHHPLKDHHALLSPP